MTSVELTFEGVTYKSAFGQINVTSVNNDVKTWTMKKTIPDGTLIDRKTGIATFKAYLPTNVSETAAVDYKVVGIRGGNF